MNELETYKEVLRRLEKPDTKRFFICEILEDILIEKGYFSDLVYDRKQEEFPEFFASKPLHINISDDFPWWPEADRTSRIAHMQNLIEKLEEGKR